ncbi:MAG: LytTR family DNA-binding domain-containing protein [Ferruginibacter sp.]
MENNTTAAKKISCIIVDDEPLARRGLQEYIEEVDFLALEGAYDNPLKAAQTITDGRVALLFMDIEMPKITGLDFFRTLQHAPPVIFITAYPQYALEGFEVNALDYLVKPVSFDRFLKAALKAKDYYDLRESNRALQNEQGAASDYFFIKADNLLVKIHYNEILYVEALQNYVSIVTAKKKYISYLTFKSVEEYLPAGAFIKTHKSFIVAADKIESVDGNDIKVGDHHIPVSRNLREDVMEKLLKGKFLKR